MLKKQDLSELYQYNNNHCNPDGVLLTLNSDYNLVSAELESINVDYENRTIDEIIQELKEIRNYSALDFYDKNFDCEFETSEDEDLIKINFLIGYMENLQLYLQQKS